MERNIGPTACASVKCLPALIKSAALTPAGIRTVRAPCDKSNLHPSSMMLPDRKVGKSGEAHSVTDVCPPFQ